MHAYWTSMLWSIDSCQNRVFASQYHLTVSRAQALTYCTLQLPYKIYFSISDRSSGSAQWQNRTNCALCSNKISQSSGRLEVLDRIPHLLKLSYEPLLIITIKLRWNGQLKRNYMFGNIRLKRTWSFYHPRWNLSCKKSGCWKLRKYWLLIRINYAGITELYLRHSLQNKFALVGKTHNMYRFCRWFCCDK